MVLGILLPIIERNQYSSSHHTPYQLRCIKGLETRNKNINRKISWEKERREQIFLLSSLFLKQYLAVADSSLCFHFPQASTLAQPPLTLWSSPDRQQTTAVTDPSSHGLIPSSGPSSRLMTLAAEPINVTSPGFHPCLVALAPECW